MFFFFFLLQTIYTIWVVENYNSNQKIEDLDIDGREKEDGNRGEVQETELKTLLKKLEGKGWYEED